MKVMCGDFLVIESRFNFLCHCVLLFLLLPCVLTHASRSKVEDTRGHEKNKTYISADRLVSRSRSGMVIFSGNVTLKQDRTTIKADNIAVYYRKSRQPRAGRVNGLEAVRKIEANGRVVIRFDDMVAKTSEAVYTKINQKIVLSGPGSLIQQGSHSISGLKIIIYMDEKNIRVSGNSDHRVHAIFFRKK